MIILGIDPSLNATGYGLIKKEGSRLIYIASGVVKVGQKDEFHQKLLKIGQTVENLILEFKPQKAGIEETFVNMNAQSSLKLGAVRGGIILTFARLGLQFAEFSPNYIKKTITGNGKADKSQLGYMIPRLLSGVNEKIFETEDETDALGIAIAAAI